jgi:hypothetical protein
MQISSVFKKGLCLMQMPKRWLVAITLVVGTILIVGAGGGWADDEDDREIAESVRKIAKAGAANKPDAAQKESETLAKKMVLGDVMNSFKSRKHGGLGIGPKPGAIMPDGIEAKVIALAKKKLTAAEVKAQAADLEQMGNDIAAISYVADAQIPLKRVVGPKAPEWTKWTREMQTGAKDLSKAAKAQDAEGIKKAAMKASDSCNNCHGVFR